MTVGSLLHVGIEPVVGAIVGPGDHITFLQQVVLVGLAAQGAVHDNTGLSAGDVGVGTIGAVPKTLDQAGIHGRLNVTRAPQILRDIGEIALVVLHLGLEEADGHLGELAAGDLGIGAESTVLIAVDDSHAAQCGDSVVTPQVRTTVGVTVSLAPVCIPGLIRQQAEEDRGNFAASDGAVRPQCAVLIADDILGMKLALQQGMTQTRGSKFNVQ